MNKGEKISKYVFYVLIGLHALYQLGFGATSLVNPQSLMAFGFNYQATPESYLVVLMLSFSQFFLTAMAILSIYFTNKNHTSGVILGITLGFYFLILGIAGIITVDSRITLYIDVLRGLLTIMVGFIVLKKIKPSDK